MENKEVVEQGQEQALAPKVVPTAEQKLKVRNIENNYLKIEKELLRLQGEFARNKEQLDKTSKEFGDELKALLDFYKLDINKYSFNNIELVFELKPEPIKVEEVKK